MSSDNANVTNEDLHSGQMLAADGMLEAIVNGMEYPVFAKDRQHRWIFMNDAFCRLLGNSLEEMLGKTDHDYFDNDLADEFWASDDFVIASGEEHFRETTVTRDGRKRTTVTKKFRFEDPATGEYYVIGVIRDVTQRKVIEDALDETEAEAQALFDYMLDGFAYHEMVLDADGVPEDYVYLEVNSAFLELTGLTDNEVTGKRVSEVFPDIRESEFDWIGTYGNVAMTGEPVRFESLFEPLGRWYSIQAYSPEKGRFVTVFQDITARKSAEKGLVASEDRFRKLFEQSNDAIFIHNLDGLILNVNQRACELMRETRSRLVGTNISGLHPKDFVQPSPSALETTVATGECRFESLFQRSDGTCVNVEVSASLVDAERGVVQGVVRDITIRKRHEERQRVEMQQADLLANMATALVNLPEAGNLYQFAADQMKDCIQGVALVAVTSFSEDLTGYALEAISTLGPTADYIRELIGVDPFLLSGNVKPENQDELRRGRFRLMGSGIAALSGGALTASVGKAIEKVLGLGEVYSISLVRKGNVHGNVALLMRKGELGPDSGFVEALAGQLCVGFEKHGAQQALRASEERFRQIVAYAPFPIMIHADDGKIISTNDIWSELSGYPPDDLQSTSDWIKLAYGPDREQMQGEMDGLYELESRTDQGEARVTCKDGTHRTWHMSSAPLGLLPDGRRLVMTMAADVTESRKAKREIRALARFPGESPNPVLRIGPDGVIQFANVAAKPLLAHWDCHVGGSLPGYWCSRVASALDKKQTITAEEHCGDAYYSMLFAPVPEGPYVNVYGLDITEQRLLEFQVRQQQRLEAMGTLAGGVAHEINNPINGIMNYAQLIIDRDRSDGEAADFAGEIIHETKRVATIVRNLLTFARADQQEWSVVGIHEVVNATLSLIRTVVSGDQIELHVDLDDDLPPINCRSQQIQQVLMNLLTNARDALNLKYAGYHEDKVIRLSASLAAEQDHQWLELVVEDRGVGIEPGVAERMFDPFFTTKPKDVGTGLGLSIAHGIVVEHGGSIRAETGNDGFTRLIVSLPVAERMKDEY